jgi:hypothetical protein
MRLANTSRTPTRSRSSATPLLDVGAALRCTDGRHARHAPLGDVIALDFINTRLEPGARAGIELTLETAKELRAALDRAIAAAEFEEADARGKDAVPRLVRAASHAR